MTIWTQYLQNVADFMNVTTVEAGIISSLIVTVGLIVVVLISTRGSQALVTVPVTVFFCTLTFSYLGWFPTWTGSVIALVVVIFLAWVLSRMPGGS